jgi:hypothetical protein
MGMVGIAKMYLSVGRRCPTHALFDLPHKDEPMSAKAIQKRYPKFADIFDGQSLENTLSFYYKKNKETGVYGFIDEEAEAEVAELLGVKVKVFKDTSIEEEEEATSAAMTTKDVGTFKEHMEDIRSGIDWLNTRS